MTESSRSFWGVVRLLAAGAFALGAPTSVLAQNLIQNGGFEIGCVVFATSCPGWVGGGSAFVDNNPVHTGSFSFGVLESGSGSLQQVITVARPGTYTLSFFDFAGIIGGNITASATIGGKVVYNQTFVLPSGFSPVSIPVTLGGGTTTLEFDATGGTAFWTVDDVSLTLLQALSLTSGLPPGAPQNAVNVTQAIDTFLGNGGTLPAGFNNLFSLTPAQLQAAASQLSGESATGAQQSSYQLMTDFLTLMMEPSTFGNGGGASTAFAPERAQSLPPDVAMAYASVLKAPPAPTVAGWNVWGSAYGGAGHLNGDAAVVGSHDLSTTAGGVAAGADRFVTPNTRVGFALAGGFTGWGLSDGFGSGRGDAFQAGVYSRTTLGPAYLSGALAFAEHWMSTDRFALGDHLTANFAATSFGGRLEGGYQLPTSSVGVTPYVAVQAQRFHTPGFSETDLTGGGFGLTFNAQSSSDTRAELGSRFDKLIALDQGAILALRGRLAWAHDWITNPVLTATFQALPGASFVVNGAAPRHDAALVSFGPEVTWRNGWSLMAKFDGEFASGEQFYSGTARLRYAW